MDTSIESKITSAKDTDFYQVRSMGEGGYLSVHIGNESKTLIPELRVYDSNKNSIGETGDPDYRFLAQANATYYLQVSGQSNTTGIYTLKVRNSAIKN